MTPTITRRDLKDLEARYAKIGDENADPVWLIDRDATSRTQEIEAFLVSCFAYGSRKVFMRVLRPFLDSRLTLPAYLANASDAELQRVTQGFTYRFHKAPHLLHLLRWLRAVVQEHDRLGAFFKSLWLVSNDDIGELLNRVALSFYSLRVDVGYLSCRAPGRAALALVVPTPIKLLFAAPAAGSACKRPLMFMRWMARTGKPDLGLWSWFPKDRLLVPLDTHLWQLSTAFGWTARKSPDFQAAQEVTAELARLDPTDPVRWDYPLCSLGAELATRGRASYRAVMEQGVRAFFSHSPARTPKTSGETPMNATNEVTDPRTVTPLELGPHPRGGKNKIGSGKAAKKKKPAPTASNKKPSAKKPAPKAKPTAKKTTKPAAKKTVAKKAPTAKKTTKATKPATKLPKSKRR